jgi:2-amino-4-hydroxy-6-hydroxymethyldihydropteridine diphosphokinase
MEVALSLGTNLGRRMENLRAARAQLDAIPDSRVLEASPVYETEPVDVASEHQSDFFLNAIVLVETALPLPVFSRHIHHIESELGRVRAADRNAPRVIDIDIICAGTEHSTTTELTVPHARWAVRRFVVQPLADVRPGWVLPGETRTVRQVLDALPPEPVVRVYSLDWKAE